MVLVDLDDGVSVEHNGVSSTRSFIDTFNKEVYQDESYNSESDSGDDDHDDDFIGDESDDDFGASVDGAPGGHRAKGTGGGGGAGDVRSSEAREIEDLSRRETNSMRVWRAMVFLLIIVTCVAVTSVIYIVLHQAETRDAALSVSYIVAHTDRGYASDVLVDRGLL